MLKISAVYLIGKAEIPIHYTTWALVEQALLNLKNKKLLLQQRCHPIAQPKYSLALTLNEAADIPSPLSSHATPFSFSLFAMVL